MSNFKDSAIDITVDILAFVEYSERAQFSCLADLEELLDRAELIVTDTMAEITSMEHFILFRHMLNRIRAVRERITDPANKNLVFAQMH